MARFDGKPVYRTSTGAALKKTRAELDKAWNEAKTYRHSGASQPKKEEKAGPYKHLLTGVSFMLPMVVAGGLIIALSFVFGIEAFKVEGTLRGPDEDRWRLRLRPDDPGAGRLHCLLHR